MLCGMFGIPPDQAFALSLIKRAADLVIGLPGLVGLQVLEGKRLRANYSRHPVQLRTLVDVPAEGG
jgi:hypothetical protein